jgi:hypothetical protein
VQFDTLFSKPLQTSKPVPKPSNEAQARERSAIRVPFSNVYGTLMRRAQCAIDGGRANFAHHARPTARSGSPRCLPPL